MISGALAGLGRATILVTYSGEFNGSVAGMGFLALAAYFGQWKPMGILRGDVLLRLCGAGQCLTSRAFVAGDPRSHPQGIPLCGDLAGADLLLKNNIAPALRANPSKRASVKSLHRSS